jgi:hypothetical protein
MGTDKAWQGSLALFVAPLGQDVAKAKQMRPWF